MGKGRYVLVGNVRFIKISARPSRCRMVGPALDARDEFGLTKVRSTQALSGL
jgi:hypothetical protein